MRPSFLVLFLSVVLGGTALGLGWVWHDLHTPLGAGSSTTVQVTRGETLRPLLGKLQQQGMLRHPQVLYVYARLRHRTAVRVGSYALRAEQTPLSILEILTEGRVMLEAFTLAEGLNRWQVRTQLDAEGWLAADQFNALCDDANFLASQKVPGPSCEGYLFPDTYKMARGLEPQAVMGTLLQRYRSEMSELLRGPGLGPLGLTERQFVTLASIVEKETGAPEERPRIACVFYNRLRARPAWRLETDPTVIYAAILADPHFDGNLKRTHLRDLDSPYNTYRRAGLPPGPIANPGRAALQAVNAPSTCGDFFFVSSNHGHHVFCPNLACHNRAVQRWQIDYFRRPTRQGLPSAPLPQAIRPPGVPPAAGHDRPDDPPDRRRSPPSYSPSRAPDRKLPPR